MIWQRYNRIPRQQIKQFDVWWRTRHFSFRFDFRLCCTQCSPGEKNSKKLNMKVNLKSVMLIFEMLTSDLIEKWLLDIFCEGKESPYWVQRIVTLCFCPLCKDWQALEYGMTRKKKQTPSAFVHLLYLSECMHADSEAKAGGRGHSPTHVGTVPFHWARALGTASHLMALEPCSV